MVVINNGQPFTLEFVTADESRGTGGKLIEVRNWMKLRNNMPVGTLPGYTKKFTPKKDSRNHENRVFRIFNPANKTVHPITVHYRLMQSINGKKILNG